jgi:CelD/BcsL family acetyltransferase involved in cellulose biosynthesis
MVATMDGDGPASAMRVVVVRDAERLREHRADLEELCAAAMEPNVFYEPWVLFPAIDAFGAKSDLWFLLVYEDTPSPAGRKASLCGFLPFERGRRFGGLPLKVLRLWKYGTAYCGLCTPLIRQDRGPAVLSALRDWTQHAPDRPTLLEWQRIGGDGPVYKLLVDFLTDAGIEFVHVASRTRPLLACRSDAEEFFSLAYSARHRSTNRRKERRLAELGRLESRELTHGEDARPWVDEFIRLESAGWKAGQSSALATNDASCKFFRAVIDHGWPRRRVALLELRLDGQMIGGMCNLLAPPGSFLYKVAIDERFGKHSPGELLQQQNIHSIHARADIQWMDSLAEPSFEHIYRWLDRRTMQSVVWSAGSASGDLALSVSPALKWVRRRVSRSR